MKSVRKCKKSVGKCKRKQLGGNLWENVTFSWKLMTLSIFNHGNAFGRIREIKFADSDNVQFWGKNSGKEACSGLSGMWKMVNMREVNCLWTKEASKAKCISIKCSRRSCSRSLSLTFNHIRPYLYNEKQLQKHSVYKMIIYQWKRLTAQLSVVWLAAVVRFSRTDMDCSWNVLALWPHHTTLVDGSGAQFAHDTHCWLLTFVTFDFECIWSISTRVTWCHWTQCHHKRIIL